MTEWTIPTADDWRERFVRRVDEMNDRELAAMLRRFRRDPSPQTEKIDIMAATLRERSARS